MLQLHLSDQQFDGLLKCVLYWRLDGTCLTNIKGGYISLLYMNYYLGNFSQGQFPTWWITHDAFRPQWITANLLAWGNGWRYGYDKAWSLAVLLTWGPGYSTKSILSFIVTNVRPQTFKSILTDTIQQSPSQQLHLLKYWGQDKMTANLLMIFSSAFSWMRI